MYPIRTTIMRYISAASEGLGRYCFHRCLSVHMGENPKLWSQVLSGWRGETQSLVPGPFPPSGPRSILGGYPRQDWGTPLARTGLPPPPPGRTDYTAGGMPLAVSHRRTFLFRHYLYYGANYINKILRLVFNRTQDFILSVFVCQLLDVMTRMPLLPSMADEYLQSWPRVS